MGRPLGSKGAYPKNRKSRVLTGPQPSGWKQVARKERPCRHCKTMFLGLGHYCSRKCALTPFMIEGEGCWEWRGYKRPGGYGEAYFHQDNKRVRVLAHRAVFEAFVAPLKDGQVVCHTCDNPKCVRPGHLFAGTPADNSADRNAKGRQARGERNGPAKLTEAQVREIRADPRGCRRLSKAYGVGQTTIQNIRRRTTWTHVE